MRAMFGNEHFLLGDGCCRRICRREGAKLAQSGSSFERTFAISAIYLPSLPHLIRYNRRAWSKREINRFLLLPPFQLPLLC